MILVFDADGRVFNTLRDLDLGVPLWRVTDPDRLESTEHVDLAVIAAYERGAWDAPRVHRGYDTIVVTTAFDADEALLALDLGIFGYVSQMADRRALRAAIVGCLAGEPGYERRVIGRWLHTRDRCVRAHASETLLTVRQREVLQLVAEGLADKEIGQRLGIATVTAQKHVTNILERLHVPNRAAAAAAVCSAVGLARLMGIRALSPNALAIAS